MISHYASLLISLLFLVTSCKSETQELEDPVVTAPASPYEYRLGLGYGFLNKAVQVTIDDHEVLFIVGTEEIEQFAQLQGTWILESGSSPKKDITIRVTVDGGQPFEQVIDLSTGMVIHIYYEQTGLRVYNTRFLVHE